MSLYDPAFCVVSVMVTTVLPGCLVRRRQNTWGTQIVLCLILCMYVVIMGEIRFHNSTPIFGGMGNKIFIHFATAPLRLVAWHPGFQYIYLCSDFGEYLGGDTMMFACNKKRHGNPPTRRAHYLQG